MKLRTKEIAIAISLVSSMALADEERTGRVRVSDHPLKNSAPICKVYLDAFLRARDGDNRAEEQTLKISELPNVVKILKELNATSVTDREKLIAEVNDATSFDELGNTLMQNTSQRCFPERLSILRTLLETMRTKKINSVMKKDIVDAIREHFRSDINMSIIGIRVNAGMAALTCSKKLEKDLGIQCQGLREFMNGLRHEMRDAFRDGMKEARTFTFFGRILYYWDKWVNKKSAKEMDDNLDRYFDYRPFQKHILDEFEAVKKSRQEFEKFVI